MMTKLEGQGSALVASGIFLLLAGPVAAAATIGETVGQAYDLESGELLYSETHCVSSDGLGREVSYQDTGGKLIASKVLDYSSGPYTPSFVQQNHYSNQSITVGLEDQGAVSMSVIDREDRSASKRVLEQPAADLPVVIDAGFDVFVRQHWDELVAGNTREFQFPFAGRQSLVELRIQPLSCSYETSDEQCFRLDLSNWLLRALAKPIELGYDAENRRLTRYRGLSNIGDENGNGLQVDIHYSYEDLPPQACHDLERRMTGENQLHSNPGARS